MSNKPVKTYKLKGVEVAEFKNETSSSFKIQKSYKDKSGEWKQTEYMFLDDLLKLQSVIESIMSDNINIRRADNDNPEVREQPVDDDFSDEIPF